MNEQEHAEHIKALNEAFRALQPEQRTLLFRLELNVGIENFRVLIHGCTTVVAGRHRLVI